MRISTDALLFDMDGTLISSMESVLRCWNAWAQEYGIPEDTWAGVQLHGRTAREIIADLLPADQVDQAVARIAELEIADVSPEGITVLPGTLDLLTSLPDESWAVVTSASHRLAEARLQAVGIRTPLCIGAEDVQRGKPDPQPFLVAAEKLGIDPARCTVFEDAPVGLASGRAAGMTTVALTTTHRSDELDADVTVQDLSHVRAEEAGQGVELTVG
ncbi:HAD-IA family hydrolase [Streptomyces boninensis]|uniref:HAD-IA family hydrolase n=1 Tax=Streptomyces boninensis TaxID=2039455 RepID=UPI003B223E2F